MPSPRDFIDLYNIHPRKFNLILKYKIIDKKRIELYAETGYFWGNYCPNCYPSNEYYNRNLQYWGALADFNFQPFKLISKLWITSSFATNNTIRKNGLSGYNVFLLGVQYRFGKKHL